MPFKIICSCGVALLAGDDLESFKVACPECGGYTLLPSIPDPYKLPTNAEMIALEEEEIERAPKPRERTGTVRKRAGVARGTRQQEGEISSTNIVLIVVLVVMVCIAILVAFAYSF